MTGPLRIVLVAACTLSAVATGCRSNTPVPMPDAMRSEGLRIVPALTTLHIRPASSGRISFLLRDDQNQPVSDYPIDFSIITQPGDAGSVEAHLSTDRSLTNANGSVVVQVIADRLGSDSRTAEFFVQAATPGAGPVTVDIVVTSDSYSVEIVPVAADDIVRAGTIVRNRLYFYDDARCSDVDLTNLSGGRARSRTPQEVETGGSFVYLGVSGKGIHGVAGQGLDANNVVRVAGCVDLPGSMLFEDQVMSATLLLDHLLPIPTGDFLVASDIGLTSPTPQAVGTIQTAWQEWTRCPLDPARLWLDCTIDALESNGANDPDDCIPVAGGEGQIGELLDARRGVTVQPPNGATPKGATACHDRLDRNGKPSLEALVDALFEGSRSTLDHLNLAGFSNEIALLLSSIRLTSTMHIVPDRQVNVYVVDHDLTDVGFPAAKSPITLKTTTLGLPDPGAHGIVATLSSANVGLLKLPTHGFTLRLGTAALYAFESTSLLKSRGADNTTAFVNAIAALAKTGDKTNPLAGCSALSAALCDQIGYRRDCLATACETGLQVLAHKLSQAFGSLDGKGLDFFLYGYAPVVDLDNNGRADALGTSRGSTVAVGAGLWVAQFSNPLGSAWENGVWTASSTNRYH